MANDKFSACWVSYSSLKDFNTCPRAYYIKNIFRNPATGNKVRIANPSLSLGAAVHEVIESLSSLPKDRRFISPIALAYQIAWAKVSGPIGGFLGSEEEVYKMRGKQMIDKIIKNPGPLAGLAIKLQVYLPYFWLSEEENIILCGRIDWMEYLESSDSVHIIDFKTGKRREAQDSLQLPIYCLLVENLQKRPIKKVSYWYLETQDKPVEQKMPKTEPIRAEILKIAKQIKLARALGRFKCPHSGCSLCQPLEKIVDGKAQFIATDKNRRDVFVLKEDADIPISSNIL